MAGTREVTENSLAQQRRGIALRLTARSSSVSPVGRPTAAYAILSHYSASNLSLCLSYIRASPPREPRRRLYSSTTTRSNPTFCRPRIGNCRPRVSLGISRRILGSLWEDNYRYLCTRQGGGMLREGKNGTVICLNQQPQGCYMQGETRRTLTMMSDMQVETREDGWEYAARAPKTRQKKHEKGINHRPSLTYERTNSN